MSLKNEVKTATSALEVRSLADVQALTTQSLENISENISENAFHAVRSKSAQKLAFKVASHTDGIVDDAIELLEGFLPTMFVISNESSEPLNLDIEVVDNNILEAA
jgi:endonuclease III